MVILSSLIAAINSSLVATLALFPELAQTFIGNTNADISIIHITSN